MHRRELLIGLGLSPLVMPSLSACASQDADKQAGTARLAANLATGGAETMIGA